jgi:hypothetical protein
MLFDAFLGLQLFVVLFIALHDWVPLGSLNHVTAVRAADPTAKLVRTTALSTLPFAIGLAASAYYGRAGLHGWVFWWLWVTYAALVLGFLRAWWIPYLLVRDPVRAVRYRAMFGATHAFLPERNGIRPNTLHIILHVAILATVGLLAALTYGA